MKPVFLYISSCLLMTFADIAPVGSCSDRHSSKVPRDLDIVVTLDANNISVNNAQLNAVIYFSSIPEHESCDFVGFELCEDKQEDNIRKLFIEDIGDGSEMHFSKIVDGLNPGSKYVFRAFITCFNKHSYYGIWRNFSTLKE